MPIKAYGEKSVLVFPAYSAIATVERQRRRDATELTTFKGPRKSALCLIANDLSKPYDPKRIMSAAWEILRL